MYIDQYLEEDDGRYCYAERWYGDKVEVYIEGVFRFCGCGQPEQVIKHVRDGLHHINTIPTTDECTGREDWKAEYKEWREKETKLFGSQGGAYFFYYWCDVLGFTEHGGSVPGWLTELGEHVLGDLTEMVNNNDR